MHGLFNKTDATCITVGGSAAAELPAYTPMFTWRNNEENSESMTEDSSFFIQVYCIPAFSVATHAFTGPQQKRISPQWFTAGGHAFFQQNIQLKSTYCTLRTKPPGLRHSATATCWLCSSYSTKGTATPSPSGKVCRQVCFKHKKTLHRDLACLMFLAACAHNDFQLAFWFHCCFSFWKSNETAI